MMTTHYLVTNSPRSGLEIEELTYDVFDEITNHHSYANIFVDLGDYECTIHLTQNAIIIETPDDFPIEQYADDIGYLHDAIIAGNFP